ncbi:waprin-Thr1 [Leptopilina boulardi]|uniref:waprin-Thr1 n=1 Tax=Leptopilina boulardi TaxID=63433 RepID=UPI0021F5890B|nr:waprin-Thr1 [Leptopilina boulardi]XP_051156097.1 waprin-Thr1 [Leptopilina boulardi]
MTGKISILLALFLVIGASESFLTNKEGYCPYRNSVKKCNPSCRSDSQCSFGEKCCPNICGDTSCVIASAISTGSDGGYKSSYDDVKYCAGVRCQKGEKCELDRRTKREKCVRA